MKRTGILLLVLAAVLGMSGCGETPEEPERVQVYAMDTVMEVTAYGAQAAEAAQSAEEELYRLDALLSRTRASSPVSQLNAAGTADVGEEVSGLLTQALAISDATGGAFDVTVAPVVSAWGFTTDSYRVPGQEELAALLQTVGGAHVSVSGSRVTLDPGTQIDLGGIAKGYASDRVGAIFAEDKIPRGLIQLGGNILAWGSREDGSGWRVGVQDPAQPDDSAALAGILELKDAFAVTSGSYQRYFEQDGKIYHHIIDPATGYPADSDLTSVTVVAGRESGSGTLCDALSTALFVMGEAQAENFWRSGKYDFQMVMVTKDGRVVATEGLKDCFTPQGKYDYETVS